MHVMCLWPTFCFSTWSLVLGLSYFWNETLHVIYQRHEHVDLKCFTYVSCVLVCRLTLPGVILIHEKACSHVLWSLNTSSILPRTARMKWLFELNCEILIQWQVELAKMINDMGDEIKGPRARRGSIAGPQQQVPFCGAVSSKST